MQKFGPKLCPHVDQIKCSVLVSCGSVFLKCYFALAEICCCFSLLLTFSFLFLSFFFFSSWCVKTITINSWLIIIIIIFFYHDPISLCYAPGNKNWFPPLVCNLEITSDFSRYLPLKKQNIEMMTGWRPQRWKSLVISQKKDGLMSA